MAQRDEQRTWRACWTWNRLLQESTDRQLQRDSGIPVTYYAILVTLSEAPDRSMRMSALADALEGSQSRLSRGEPPRRTVAGSNDVVVPRTGAAGSRS